MKDKNITIEFIAEVTNTSRQTVSRVINNSGYVKAETRERIEEAIEKYNYKPNLYARNLGGGKKNKNILLSVKADLGSSATMWLNMLINKIVSANKDENLTIIIEQYFDERDFQRSLINTTNSFVDGVVIFYEEENDRRKQILKKAGIPYIVYGRPYDINDVCVGLDNEQAVRLVTEYLFSKGLYNILFVSAFPSPVNSARELALKTIYMENNIDLSKLDIITNVKNIEEIHDLTIKKLKENNKIDAIFVSGDEKSVGVLTALSKLNIQVPEEISVFGFDNIPISKFLTPSLSTVNFDYDGIAKTIIDKIVNMMDGKFEESMYFEGELLIRESTI